MVWAELRLALHGITLWWYLVAAGLFAACLFTPLFVSRGFLVAAWIWPLLIWSKMGTRERLFRTDQLVFSTAHPLRRQLPACWLAGVIIAVITGGGTGLRLFMAGDQLGLLAWTAGALFIPTMALTLGVWSGSSKLFEVLYLFLWYLGPGEPFGRHRFHGRHGAASSVPHAPDFSHDHGRAGRIRDFRTATAADPLAIREVYSRAQIRYIIGVEAAAINGKESKGKGTDMSLHFAGEKFSKSNLDRVGIVARAELVHAFRGDAPAGFVETQFGGNLAARPLPWPSRPMAGYSFASEWTAARHQERRLLATPFVSLWRQSTGERGLLGVAFDPNFATNQFVYLYYTTSTAPIHNRISRFTANGDVAVAGSETVLVDLENLSATQSQRRRHPLRPGRQTLRSGR